jgi:uncharacterized protein with PQ loop repeat
MTSLGCLNRLEELSTPLVLFGVGSALLVVLNQIPQYRKLLRSQAAEGVSAATLGIGNVASSFNVVNLTILHANQVKLCFAGGASSFRLCQSSLLVLYSGLCGFFACFPYYLIKLRLTHKNGNHGGAASTRDNRMLLGLYLQVFVIGVAAVPALLSILPEGDCEQYRDYANTIGFLNTILLCSQYLPQIWTSYKFKGSGAVSYATLGCDSVGGYVMVLYRIYGTSERLSSWLPYLVFHSSELVVILVAWSFDRHKKKRGKRSPYKKLLGLDIDREGVLSSYSRSSFSSVDAQETPEDMYPSDH